MMTVLPREKSTSAVAHAAALFCCLPESEFTTGQVLLVDGAHDSYLPEY